MKKTLRIIIGILFIIVGLIGFLVPVVPGFALLFVGLELAGIGFLIPACVRRFFVNLFVIAKMKIKNLKHETRNL